jgi:capsid protein
VWPVEVKKWAPDLTVQVAVGTADQRRRSFIAGGDIVVFNYDNLDKLPELDFDGIVFDELTRLKNPSGKRFKSLLKVLDRYSAQGAGISYYSLTGDYESTSFASVRAAKLDEDGQIRPLQQWFATQVALPMRRRFNALAAVQGMFTTIDATEFAANVKRYQRFEGMGPGRELLDPDAETNAAIGRLRSGLSTLKIECGKRGLHWVRVLRQMSLENRLVKVLGVLLDFSKGQGGQVTGNTRDAASQGQSTTETAT